MAADAWEVGFLSQQVLDEFEALPADVRARFQRIFRLAEAHGLAALVMPLARPLEGPLWELRASGRDGIARGLYVAQSGKRVVLLRFFAKKTQRTPRREIETALARLREVAQ
ncbi:MAG: type II toxin-antitoxin system RelE/ParE family toxin [Desulfovibrio sp.]|jgi:phage-related protein|nr:type II toxin-antitoxin system RelE/ParE family toxin [Desulfovibrio sp.]